MGNRREPVSVLTGSIKSHLIRLALPSMGGMFAMIIFNLTDTFFVSMLGTEALGAMGFTFPVVMIVGSLASGISVGAGSILARAMGRGDHHTMSRTATDGILLSVLAVAIISFVGIWTMDPLFRALGASGEALELVKSYMYIWYIGAAVVVIPPVSDSCMRAMGDMVRPLMVMLVCAVTNAILDPILIFGWFGFPAMGIAGASLATIIARSLGMVATLSFVHFHYRLINFRYASLKELTSSWWGILSIGIPSVIVRLLPQLVRGSLTRLAATAAGVAGVAAIAAGSRIEGFATIVSMAIGVAMVPIIGQNFGAGAFTRVDETRRIISKFAVAYGLALFGLAFWLATPLSRIFSADPAVIALIRSYLLIVFVGSIGLNMYNWLSEALNAVGKPKVSLLINSVGTCLIIVPAIWLGSSWGGFTGMLMGLALGQIIVGGIAWVVVKTVLTPKAGSAGVASAMHS